jgi:hypothetical protein
MAALVGVLLYLELRARKEHADLDTIRAELQIVGLSKQHVKGYLPVDGSC